MHLWSPTTVQDIDGYTVWKLKMIFSRQSTCCGHQVCTSESIIKNVAWRADQISARSVLIKSIGSRECVSAGITHSGVTVLMAHRARSATGTSAMKYTRTKKEKEVKKQEIKNLKTICMSKNGKCQWQTDSLSFLFRDICPALQCKVYRAQKMEEDARQWRRRWEFVQIAIKKLKTPVSEIKKGKWKKKPGLVAVGWAWSVLHNDIAVWCADITFCSRLRRILVGLW